MIEGHGGNIYKVAKELGCKISDIIDMSSNINPLGPTDELLDYLKQNLNQIANLPEVDSKSIINAFGEYYNLNPKNIICGNGTTQLIYLIPEVLKTKKALIYAPSYSDYADACIRHNVKYEYSISDEFKKRGINSKKFRYLKITLQKNSTPKSDRL